MILLALASAAAAAAHLLWVVPRLPRPRSGPDGTPPNYAELASCRSALLLAGIVAALALTLWRVPVTHYPMWLAYLGGGAALAWVDLKTMWLPKRLHWIVGGELALAIAVSAWNQPMLAVGAGLGSWAAFAMLWLVWRFSHGFGFGDVRLGLLVGAIAGATGIQTWITALFAGTLIGAVWAVARRLLRGPASFPYGPSLWLGPIAMALAT